VVPTSIPYLWAPFGDFVLCIRAFGRYFFFWQEVTSYYEEWEWPSTPGRSGYKGRRRPEMVGCRTPILTSAMLIREDGAEWEWPSTPGRSGYKGRRRPGMVGCRTPILTSAMLIREDGA